MFPKIIIHNSISIEGSLTNFEPNMGLHYKIAGNYQPDVHLIGSSTIKTGIEIFGGVVPPEEEMALFVQIRLNINVLVHLRPQMKHIPQSGEIIHSPPGVMHSYINLCLLQFLFKRSPGKLSSTNPPGMYSMQFVFRFT